jgi:hypothetical protein
VCTVPVHFKTRTEKREANNICQKGLGGSVNTFKSLARLLPGAYNQVLVDFQGFGDTPLTSKTEPLSVAKHVSDLNDLVLFLRRDSNGRTKEGKVRTIHSNKTPTI